MAESTLATTEAVSVAPMLSVHEHDAEESVLDMRDHMAAFPQRLPAEPEWLLHWWYSEAHPTENDLIHEIGGDSLFYINGDTLLLKFLLDDALGNMSEKPQFLRFFYAVERYLLDLSNCGGHFSLLFFDGLKPLYDATEQHVFWFARQAFILHCRNSNIDCIQMSSWYDPDYTQLLSTANPNALLIDDGTTCLSHLTDEQERHELRFLLLSCVHATLRASVVVSLLGLTKRVGRKYLCPTLLPDMSLSTLAASVDPRAKEMINESLEEEDNDEASSHPVSSDIRVACLHSLLQGIDGCETSDVFVIVVLKLVFITIHFQSTLSLDRRAMKGCAALHLMAADDSMSLSDALNFLFAMASGVLSSFLTRDCAFVPESVVDFFDYNLFSLVTYQVLASGDTSALCIDEPSRKALESSWKQIGGSDLFDVDFACLGSTVLPALPDMTPLEDTELLPMQNQFMSCLNVKEQMPKTQIVSDDSTTNDAFFSAHDAWDRALGVDLAHDLMKTLDENEREADKAFIARFKGTAEAAMRKRRERKEARAANTVELTVQSLGNKGLHHPIVVVEGRQHVWNAVAEETKPKRHDVKAKPKKGAKLSKKDLIIQANQEANKKEIGIKDDERLKTLEKRWKGMLKVHGPNPDKFCLAILVMCAGKDRIMDSCMDFPAVSRILLLPSSQYTLLRRILEDSYKKITSYRSRMFSADKDIEKVRKCVEVLYKFSCDFVRCYLDLLTGDDIKLIQRLQFGVGFYHSSQAVYARWKSRVLERAKETSDAAVLSAIAPPKTRQLTAYVDSCYEDPDDIPLADFRISTGSEATFQLQFMGPTMDRTLGSTNDVRVCFRPDAWQRELLDIVDRQESVVVVAPTASGKTFISYYAMDQALRLDDSCLVVFVAPSKFLVRQVYAEVYGRFRNKQYPKTVRMCLSGTLLAEAAQNPTKCQILVTQPDVFEMFVTSVIYRELVKRLKYVVFDEIHSISQELGVSDGDQSQGQKWETLLQCIPCPFLALSATIGNPVTFHRWLADIKHFKDGKVHLITHNERFADLEMLMYDSRGGVSDLYRVNPFGLLHYNQVLHQDVLANFYVPPKDGLALFHALEAVLTDKDHPLAVECRESMEPNRYFSQTYCITKREYRGFVQRLMDCIAEMVTKRVLTHDDFNRLIDTLLRVGCAQQERVPDWDAKRCGELDDEADDGVKTLDLGMPTAATKQAEPEILSTAVLKDLLDDESAAKSPYLHPDSFIDFIFAMDNLKLLPSMIFNFNRSEMRRIFNGVVSGLQSRQYDHYWGTEERAHKTKSANKKNQEDYKQALLNYEAALKMASVSRSQKLDGRKRIETGAETGTDLPVAPVAPPVDISEEHNALFSFADRNSQVIHSEVYDTMVNDLRGYCDDILIEGIKRGIALHHEAMLPGYRRAVEILFRYNCIRVVITATSLAVGVHMPCKSVVYLGDSLLLTPLMFRQTSGRAGRRGYDSFGHTLFWGTPPRKIRRLLSAPLPILTGEFPVTSAQTLRLLQLQQRTSEMAEEELLLSKDKKNRNHPSVACAADHENVCLSIQSFYLSPLFGVKNAVNAPTPDEMHRLKAQSRVALRFTIDFLRRMGVVAEDGMIDGLNSFVTALIAAEPSNFVFVSMLLRGVLHGLVRPTNEDPEIERQNFLAVLGLVCRVFHTRPVYSSMELKRMFALQDSTLEPYDPVFTNTCDAVEEAVSEYNRTTLEVARGYARCIGAVDAIATRNYVLPLSGISFSRTDAPATGSQWEAFLESRHVRDDDRQAISPLVASSGCTDLEMASQDQLLYWTKEHVYIDTSLFALIPAADQQLNSYFYKFVTADKPNLKEMIYDNSLPASEAWFVLKKFTTTLNTVARNVGLHRDENPNAEPDVVQQTLCSVAEKAASYVENL